METNKTKEFIIRRDCFGNIYTQTELIRCKDCKHCDDKSNSPWMNCMRLRMTTTPYWFCADGERKEGRRNE